MFDDGTRTSVDKAGGVIFYTLPARELEEGMSTGDGQDILDVAWQSDGKIVAHVYTPRADDPDLDEENRCSPEARVYEPFERVGLAVFGSTPVDGTSHPAAIVEV